MRISDWSSDVCSSDLSKSKDGDSKELRGVAKIEHDRNEILLRKYAAYARTVMNSEKIGISADTQSRRAFDRVIEALSDSSLDHLRSSTWDGASDLLGYYNRLCGTVQEAMTGGDGEVVSAGPGSDERSEEHTSELQSLMRISSAVFCMKKKKTK